VLVGVRIARFLQQAFYPSLEQRLLRHATFVAIDRNETACIGGDALTRSAGDPDRVLALERGGAPWFARPRP
jgi:hypothetical protein